MQEYAQHILSSGGTEAVALGRCKQWLRLAAPASEVYAGLFATLKRSQDLESLLAGLRPEGMPESGQGLAHTPAP